MLTCARALQLASRLPDRYLHGPHRIGKADRIHTHVCLIFDVDERADVDLALLYLARQRISQADDGGCSRFRHRGRIQSLFAKMISLPIAQWR